MSSATTGRPPSSTKWLPKSLLEDCRRLQLCEVSEFFDAHPLLLISLPDVLSPLYSALVSSAGYSQASGGANRDAIDFRTSFRPNQEPVPAKPTNHGIAREIEQVRKLASRTIYVHVLKKRGYDAAFLDKITVGRTHNHDVVLRDSSVSKFHASFHLKNDGVMTLRDMDSTNHTFVNGNQVLKPRPLVPGDRLMFGSVETLFCSAEGFWSAFTQR